MVKGFNFLSELRKFYNSLRKPIGIVKGDYVYRGNIRRPEGRLSEFLGIGCGAGLDEIVGDVRTRDDGRKVAFYFPESERGYN